jgi:hypothetical protein
VISLKISEAIARVNSSKPNTYLDTEKVQWLSTLEWNIMRDIIETHEDADKVKFSGYDSKTSLDTELIAPAPYDEMYVRYLEAQIDYANGELGKYNNSIAMFNSAITSFRNYYNREHLPLQKHKIDYF